MLQAVTFQSLTIQQFLQLVNDDDPIQYELVRGRLVAMPEPSDQHEEIVRFLDIEFALSIRQSKLNWTTRRRNLLELDPASGRRPDLAVIEKPERWRENEIEQGIKSVPYLIVEVASSNWSNDLVDKQEEYEALGIPEYWIVDYKGQIPAKYCLRGKGKKVIVLTLENGAYKRVEYVLGETVPCQTFPDLMLTVDQIVSAGV